MKSKKIRVKSKKGRRTINRIKRISRKIRGGLKWSNINPTTPVRLFGKLFGSKEPLEVEGTVSNTQEGTVVNSNKIKEYTDSGITKIVIFEPIPNNHTGKAKIIEVIIKNGNTDKHYVPKKEIIIDPKLYTVNDTNIDLNLYKSQGIELSINTKSPPNSP